MAFSDIAKHLLEVLPGLALWLVFILLWLSKCPRAYQGLVAGLLFCFGFIAGWLGFLNHPICADAMAVSWSQCASNAVHSTLQLIVLNVDAKDTQGFLLSFARVALPLATAQVLVPRQWLLRLSLLSSRVAVLVLGSRRTGLALAKYYARSQSSMPTWERRSILGIDEHLDQPDVLAFQEHVPVLKAALHDPQELMRLSLRKREHIVICTGNDLADIELARRIVRLLPRDATKGPQITICIESTIVPRACWLDPELCARYLNGKLSFFHADDSVARALLLSYAPHALHIEEGRFTAGGTNACHIVVCGDGPLVEALIAQAVRALVYSPDQPLKVTALVPHAVERQRAFFLRFPALAKDVKTADEIYGKQVPLAEIAFIESSAEQINASALRAAGHIDAIYAVGREDGEARVAGAEAIKAVMTLSGPKRTPVVVCVDEPARVGPFSSLDPAIPLEIFDASAWVDERHNLAATRGSMTSLPDDLADDIAMRLWWVYAKKPKDVGPEFVERAARPLWLATSHHEHAWNRYAADHAIVKFELAGLTAESSAKQVEETVKRYDVWLSRLEHRRYVCERMVDGWLRNPNAFREGETAQAKALRNKAKDFLLNYTLRPFDELPDFEKEKDDAIVKQIFDALEALRALHARVRKGFHS